jgi:peptidoglycan-N-acetylglucosamine deacetylase
MIYLTFDDGPDPEWTPRVLDMLAATRATATFFVIGRSAQRWPALVRRAASEGHAIGNHTLSHRHPWTMSAQEARNEVIAGAAAIADALGGASPGFYRPPHGRVRRAMSDAAKSIGEQLTLWDLSAVDWGPLGSSQRIGRRLSRARDGEIVLMHDGINRHNRPDELAHVLPAFLADLQRRAVRAVAMS